MVDTCSTTDLSTIRTAFREEKIILTDGSGWAMASGVFLSADEEDVPGAALIRKAVLGLALWRKVGVADRPTADLAIQWLRELPSGKALTQDDARRVRALIARHHGRIWNECGHWLNLAGEWVAVGPLGYALTTETLVPWKHLHEWIKQKTADLQRLPAEITEALPFSNLPRLADCIDDRFYRDPQFEGPHERKAWLNVLGAELRRIELENEAETHRVRGLAARLADTVWQTTARPTMVPYIGETPAGIPRTAEVVWLHEVLYVDHLSNAKLARLVPDLLGKIFGRDDITAALIYSFCRSPGEVKAYLEENFKLGLLGPVSTADVNVNAGSLTLPDQAPGDEETSPPGGAVTSEDEVATESKVESPVDVPIDQNERDGPGSLPTNNKATLKPHEPSIMESFAREQGFERKEKHCFVHADGSRISREDGEAFPWIRRKANGEVSRYYWPKKHCLERGPLEIKAEVWGLIDDFPELYSLVLLDPEGGAKEVSGEDLHAMRDAGRITLYPAAYRLVIRRERK